MRKTDRHGVLYRASFTKNQRNLSRQLSKQVLDDTSDQSSVDETVKMNEVLKEPFSATNKKLIKLTTEIALKKGRSPLEMERTQDFELLESGHNVTGPSVLIHDDDMQEPGRLAASFDAKSLAKSNTSFSP